jgi:hypothetical protein
LIDWLAHSPLGVAPKCGDHNSDCLNHLLFVPPRMQTSSHRITASYAFDARWARRKQMSRHVQEALRSARRLERSKRITLRRMWCCFPEVDPFPMTKKQSKIAVSLITCPSYRPSHHGDRCEPAQGARKPYQRTDIMDSSISSTILLQHNPKFDSLLDSWWLFKLLSTFVHRNPFQRLEGQPRDAGKPSSSVGMFGERH